MQQLEIGQELKDNILVLTLKGQLDVLTADRLHAIVTFIQKSAISYVVMDFHGVRLVDSSGVGALVSLFKLTRARRGDTVLARVGAHPMEVFKILNLTKVITMYDSLDNAVSDLQERDSSPGIPPEPAVSNSRTDIPRPSAGYTAA